MGRVYRCLAIRARLMGAQADKHGVTASAGLRRVNKLVSFGYELQDAGG